MYAQTMSITSTSIQGGRSSLFSRPFQFPPSISVHNITWKQKVGKAWEHSPCEWTRGRHRGEEPIFKYLCTKLKSRFLTSWVVSTARMSRVLINGRVLQMDDLVCYIQLGPPRPPCVRLTSFTWWMLQGSPIFHYSSVSVYYSEHTQSQKSKNRGRLETRLEGAWRQS